jgi:hypothetical protein
VVLGPRQLLETAGPLERRDRSPAWSESLRALGTAAHKERTALFNVSRPIEAMFYAPFIAYERLPTEAEVESLTAAGWDVLILRSRPLTITPDKVHFIDVPRELGLTTE